MDKKAKSTYVVFAVVGFVMLVGAVYLYKGARAFVSGASRAEGTVVNLVQKTNRSKTSSALSPVVNYRHANGKTIEFTSSDGSDPSRYTIGQKVEVLYYPLEPLNAEINGFFAIWGITAIFGGFGAITFGVGVGSLFAGMRKNRLNTYLRAHGTPIETENHSVTHVTINSLNLFRILATWQNPATSEQHTFHSDNILFDPTDAIKGKKITVFIENNNPKKYYVDISFLSKPTGLDGEHL
jgi:uncharacterized membrane protein YjjB (DUF3815 family)